MGLEQNTQSVRHVVQEAQQDWSCYILPIHATELPVYRIPAQRLLVLICLQRAISVLDFDLFCFDQKI